MASTSAPPASKILIARLSAHGDVIQTLPLLAAIKQGDPSVFVGWVVEESAAPLLEGHPLIDRLHISRRKTWAEAFKRPWRWPGALGEMLRFLTALRAEQYDVGLDVQGLLKSSLLLFLARIPRRIGYAATRENASLLYTETLPPHDITDPHIATVDKFMEFANRLGYPTLSREADPEAKSFFPLPPLQPEAVQRVKDLLAPLPHQTSLTVLAPATIWPTKHWTETAWQTLILHLLNQGHTLIILGAPADEALVSRILEDIPTTTPGLLNWVGKTRWPDLYALFQQVDLFIGLDSAPLHIAQAVGHPRIIGLFGPTAPKRTGPIGVQHATLSTQLPCQPCFERICPLQTHACMEELTVEAVLAVLAEKQHTGLSEAQP